MNGSAPALARCVERLFRLASPAFRTEVVAAFLADWRHESALAMRAGADAELRLALVYLSRLPALGWAALAERSRPMSTLRPRRLAARALYVAAVAVLFAVPRLTGGAERPAEVVTALAALLGLGVALVAAGLALERRRWTRAER